MGHGGRPGPPRRRSQLHAMRPQAMAASQRGHSVAHLPRLRVHNRQSPRATTRSTTATEPANSYCEQSATMFSRTSSPCGTCATSWVADHSSSVRTGLTTDPAQSTRSRYSLELGQCKSDQQICPRFDENGHPRLRHRGRQHDQRVTAIGLNTVDGGPAPDSQAFGFNSGAPTSWCPVAADSAHELTSSERAARFRQYNDVFRLAGCQGVLPDRYLSVMHRASPTEIDVGS